MVENLLKKYREIAQGTIMKKKHTDIYITIVFPHIVSAETILFEFVNRREFK